MLNKKNKLSFKGIPTYILGKSLVQILKRLVMLPVHLVRFNYLALKSAITGQRNIIDRGEASFMRMNLQPHVTLHLCMMINLNWFMKMLIH